MVAMVLLKIFAIVGLLALVVLLSFFAALLVTGWLKKRPTHGAESYEVRDIVDQRDTERARFRTDSVDDDEDLESSERPKHPR